MKLEYTTVFLPMYCQYAVATSSAVFDSRISASAAGVRGLMIHLKGTGYLVKGFHVISELVCTFYLYNQTYDTNPFVKSGLSLMILPWSSTGGFMS